METSGAVERTNPMPAVPGLGLGTPHTWAGGPVV